MTDRLTLTRRASLLMPLALGGCGMFDWLSDEQKKPIAGNREAVLAPSHALSVDATGSVTLRALYPNPDGLLLPGMFVRETLTEGVRQNAILVPQRGITHDERGDPTAMVIDQNGKVAPRTLTATQAIGTNWLVEAGLAAGDRVVVSGLQQIHPGDTPNIQVVNADAPAAQKE